LKLFPTIFGLADEVTLVFNGLIKLYLHLTRELLVGGMIKYLSGTKWKEVLASYSIVFLKIMF